MTGVWTNGEESRLTLTAENYQLTGTYVDGSSGGKYGGDVIGSYVPLHSSGSANIFVSWNVNWKKLQEDDQYFETITSWSGTYDADNDNIDTLFTYMGNDAEVDWQDYIV